MKFTPQKVTGLLLISILIVSLIAVGGGLYLYQKMPHLPEMVQEQLRQKQITLEFEEKKIGPGWFEVTLHQVNLESPLWQYDLRASEAKFQIEPRLGFPFLKFTVSFDKALVAKQESMVASPPDAATDLPPASPPAYLGFLLGMVSFELKLNQTDVASHGIEGLDAHLVLGKLFSQSEDLPGGSLSYHVKMARMLKVPGLRNVAARGQLEYKNHVLQTDSSQLLLGPLQIDLKFRANVSNQQWTTTLVIPQTELQSGEPNFDWKTIEGLEEVAGRLGIEITAQGEGSSWEKLVAQGQIQAQDFKLKLNRGDAQGELKLNTQLQFEKKETLVAQGSVSVDLTQMAMSYQDQFRKPVSTPLKIKSDFQLEDKKLKLSRLDMVLDHMQAKVGGWIASDSPHLSELNLVIKDTSLRGWEKFFPQTDLKTAGSFSTDVHFKGPLIDWSLAHIQSHLFLNQVKLPGHLLGLAHPLVKAHGSFILDGKTELEVDKKQLSKLSAQTRLDLSGTELKYAEMFLKPQKTSFHLSTLLLGRGEKIDFKKASLELGPVKIQGSGSMEGLKNPQATFECQSNAILLAKAQDLFPSIQSMGVSGLGGTSRIQVQGGFKNKSLTYKAQVNLKDITAKLASPPMLQPVVLKKAEGTLYLTPSLVASKKMYLSFPKTYGVLSFDFKNKKNKDLTFFLDAKKFSIGDFYDEKQAKQVGPASVMGVPMQEEKSQQEDFRKKEWFNSLRAQGKVHVRLANLGWTQAEDLRAQLSFENKKLEIHPISMRTMGGTLEAQSRWDGAGQSPVSQVSLETHQVRAEDFLAAWSEKTKGVLRGKLNSKLSLSFRGLGQTEILDSLQGKGSYVLSEGELQTVQFTQKPLQALQKIPWLKNQITQTQWQEPIRNASGNFVIKDKTIIFDKLILHSSHFDLLSENVRIGMEKNIEAKLRLIPKASLLKPSFLKALTPQGEKEPLIPLTLGGTLTHPSIKVDESYLTRQLTQGLVGNIEKAPQVQELKKNVEKELKKGLQNLFK